MAREAWTDERLDGLNKRVDAGFREMRDELRSVNDNMLALQRTMIEQFAAQQRITVQLFGGMFAVMLIGFLSVLAAILVNG